ncbi:MAG: D-alanyl-D-alanine carboxypeptidase [Clostridiales bacterium]|nr:D-alanyl-D-alanine carboxypeptidase [Clostridiales bacterium]
MEKITKKITALFLVAIMTIALPTQAASAISNGDISAASAILIEADSGRVIYEKNGYTQMPMASTTKILSTLIALEQKNLDEYFTVDSNAIKVEGSSMGLVEGDKVTLRTLCYGMMLPSGNDAANATAVKIAGSVEKFAELMNQKAKELGMKNSSFVTPSGLDDYTDNHYSTAYDMAILTSAAVKIPEFVEICSSLNAKLNYGNPPFDRWLTNGNKLLRYCDGVYGVKTGFTDKARRCLVSACERDGVNLTCVTLNAPDDWNDHSKLYNYGFSQISSYTLSQNDFNIYANIVGGEKDNVKLKLSESSSVSLFQGEISNVKTEIVIPKFHYAPIIKGEELGRANYYIDNNLVKSVSLVACDDVLVNVPEEQGVVRKYIRKFKNFIFKNR